VSVRLRRGAGGTTRVDGVLCCAPVWFRWDGAVLWMVGSGASPVGEDHIRVRVEVGAGVTASVRSVAATVVYAARGAGTRWDTEIHVADGGRLDWRPEPVILTEHARHDVHTSVHVAAGADVTLDEVLVLGRSGEDAGALRSTLAASIDGAPVLLTSFDTAQPAWSGPAGTGGSRDVAHRLRLGGDDPPAPSPSRGAARLEPAAGCRLAVATADDVADGRRSIAAVLPA
jgi:urease accessory protein